MKEINKSIGENLKAIRKHRELTIDQLSTASGVSKSMISEIERGIRNPSITILWNLANALKKPLNYFLKEGNQQGPAIYKVNDCSSVSGEQHWIYPLMGFDEDKKFEIYFTEYVPHSQTEESVHYKGVEEYALISSGSITLVMDDQEYAVKEGEVIHFTGDKPHYYKNKEDETAKAFVLMFYPE